MYVAPAALIHSTKNYASMASWCLYDIVINFERAGTQRKSSPFFLFSFIIASRIHLLVLLYIIYISFIPGQSWPICLKNLPGRAKKKLMDIALCCCSFFIHFLMWWWCVLLYSWFGSCSCQVLQCPFGFFSCLTIPHYCTSIKPRRPPHQSMRYINSSQQKKKKYKSI